MFEIDSSSEDAHDFQESIQPTGDKNLDHELSVSPLLSTPPVVPGSDEINDRPSDDVEGLDDFEPTIGPSSSIENIIPPQVAKGWGIFSTWVVTTAVTIKEKAVEFNNSETVQEFRKKSAEGWIATKESAGPYWEKAKETASPYWEKTRETAGPYWEQTKEAAGPMWEKTKENLAVAATVASETVADFAAKIGGNGEQVEASSDHAPSVLDQAAKGGPMIV